MTTYLSLISFTSQKPTVQPEVFHLQCGGLVCLAFVCTEGDPGPFWPSRDRCIPTLQFSPEVKLPYKLFPNGKPFDPFKQIVETPIS